MRAFVTCFTFIFLSLSSLASEVYYDIDKFDSAEDFATKKYEEKCGPAQIVGDRQILDQTAPIYSTSVVYFGEDAQITFTQLSLDENDKIIESPADEIVRTVYVIDEWNCDQ